VATTTTDEVVVATATDAETTTTTAAVATVVDTATAVVVDSRRTFRPIITEGEDMVRCQEYQNVFSAHHVKDPILGATLRSRTV
jgi:hypothetical protein